MQVVIAYDGSPEAKNILASIRYMLLPKSTQLTFMHAHESAAYCTPVIPESEFRQVADFKDLMKMHASKLLEEAVESFDKSGFTFDAVLEEGYPDEVLCSYKEENKADLVITGARGLNKIQKYLLGSVTRKILNHCNLPVLVNRGCYSSKNHRILIAYESSPVCDKLCDFLQSFSLNSVERLGIISGFDHGRTGFIDDYSGYLSDLEGEKKVLETRLNSIKNQFREKFPDIGTIDSELLKPSNDCAKAIIEYADKHNYSLIALGGSGKNPVSRFFLGSVSQYVAEYAKCSVLVYKD